MARGPGARGGEVRCLVCPTLGVALLGALLVFSACKSPSEEGGERVPVVETPGASREESVASAPGAAVAQPSSLDDEGFRALMGPFQMSAVAENLQGSWLFFGGVNPVASAWHIDRGSFTFVDDEGEAKAGELKVIAPCKVAHVARGGLSEVANYHTVLATGDGVYRAGSSMGLVRGEDLVVCTGHGIIVGDRSGCALWREVGGLDTSWERSPATCEWSEGEGGRSLRASSEATGELALSVYGERLLRWTPEESRAVKVDGLETAIAGVQAANK